MNLEVRPLVPHQDFVDDDTEPNVSRGREVFKDFLSELYPFGIFLVNPYHEFVDVFLFISGLHGEEDVDYFPFHAVFLGNGLGRRHTGSEEDTPGEQGEETEAKKSLVTFQ